MNSQSCLTSCVAEIGSTFTALPQPPRRSITLVSGPFQLSYVLAFDGFPRFLDTGVVQSDRSLIAAFCGQRRDRPLTVQALSGMGA